MHWNYVIENMDWWERESGSAIPATPALYQTQSETDNIFLQMTAFRAWGYLVYVIHGPPPLCPQTRQAVAALSSTRCTMDTIYTWQWETTQLLMSVAHCTSLHVLTSTGWKSRFCFLQWYTSWCKTLSVFMAISILSKKLLWTSKLFFLE